jgi:tRNA dimethylallyltransferase
VSIDAFHRAVYLTGPTAVGKTAVGVALAQRLGAEVLALDSMTLYREMDIGTAKPTLAERGGVAHHLIDILDPWEAASVADYRNWALATLHEVESRGKRALFVGGTALYLKTLLRGLFAGPGADLTRRQDLEDEADREGEVALHRRLSVLDPVTASRIHPHDRRRVVRALEVIAATGLPLSGLQREHNRPAPPSVNVFALARPRAVVCARIDHRVAQMFADGLVAEVRALWSRERPPGSVAAQAVGYREVLDHLEGRTTLEQTIDRVRVRTRQFAKRQATWFRGLVEVRPWPVAVDEPPEVTADRLAGVIDRTDGLR